MKATEISSIKTIRNRIIINVTFILFLRRVIYSMYINYS